RLRREPDRSHPAASGGSERLIPARPCTAARPLLRGGLRTFMASSFELERDGAAAGAADEPGALEAHLEVEHLRGFVARCARVAVHADRAASAGQGTARAVPLGEQALLAVVARRGLRHRSERPLELLDLLGQASVPVPE